MTKTQQIAFFHRERLSLDEIALATGCKEWVVRLRIKAIQRGYQSKVDRAFQGWRGWPLSDKVVSL